MTKYLERKSVSTETLMRRTLFSSLIAILAAAGVLLSSTAYAQLRDPRCDIRDECTYAPHPYPRASATVVMPEMSAKAHDARCDVRDQCTSDPQIANDIARKEGGKTKYSGQPKGATN